MFWNNRIKDLERRVHNLEVDMSSMRDYLPAYKSNKSTTLGKYLDVHRITQQQIAKDLGVSQPTISRMLSGGFIPNKETIMKIYDYTKGAVQPNDFYGVSNEE